jgi:organic hydroperoxide reductase OsmC/OhrA
MATERVHEYAMALDWRGNRGAGTADYTSYDRTFAIRVEGKPELVGTADPLFRGDPQLYNPEDLLLAAVASCHLLSYLALCARQRIAVLAYSDRPRGSLALLPSGGGSFTEVLLRPRVTVAAGSDPEAAAALHHRAHELCFIANSCSFPIRHQAQVVIAGAAGGDEGRRVEGRA